MTHIAGFDRSQLLLLPEAIDDYVGLDNSVRFIDAFGFPSAYFLVSLAAPAYLRKLKQLDKRALRVSVLAVSFMILRFSGWWASREASCSRRRSSRTICLCGFSYKRFQGHFRCMDTSVRRGFHNGRSTANWRALDKQNSPT